MPTSISSAFSAAPFAMTLITANLELSKDFYGNKLGLTLVYEDKASAIFACGETMINLLAASEAAALVSPETVAPTNSGVRAVYTLRCADIDKASVELTTAGVTLLNGPIDRPWGVRTVSFQDPSGHTWELANHD